MCYKDTAWGRFSLTPRVPCQRWTTVDDSTFTAVPQSLPTRSPGVTLILLTRHSSAVDSGRRTHIGRHSMSTTARPATKQAATPATQLDATKQHGGRRHCTTGTHTALRACQVVNTGLPVDSVQRVYCALIGRRYSSDLCHDIISSAHTKK